MNEDKDILKIAAELDGLKKLMILHLISKGFRQSQIAATLGIAESTLSVMFPKGLLKEAKKLN
ncbi:helix-turn-helix domain-containing protein [Chelativorans salis]|uniref:Helix-turn-helix domain-containing protein n=1 Tax=Chelativorans salis TaxID=2978478 RepID=A0ABT2LL75_9HYPH|nr:helix-turn-helix domain-containing protein [Chelativorans sp. EGI FJ00035]MCT7374413.1 helix-turn-helix domain-containing protein [Chelativorans sp. EGI FJ00035]